MIAEAPMFQALVVAQEIRKRLSIGDDTANEHLSWASKGKGKS